MQKLLTLLLLLVIIQLNVAGQCNPSAAMTCEETVLLCSLDELDGFSCSSLSTDNPTGPNPLCNGVGTPSNTQWWTFKGNGKVVTIRFNVDLSSCSMNRGISAGVISDCGRYVYTCNADCNTNSFSLSFSSYGCRNYSLWVDGCDGDICNFDIQVTNGEARHLPSPLAPLLVFGTIQSGCNITILQPDMEGYCWEADYKWTVNGTEFSQRELSARYTIPNYIGPFEICLEVSVGKGVVVCDQATNCITLDPVPIEEIDDGEFYVCYEDYMDNGYLWRDSIIYSSCIDPPCKKILKIGRGCNKAYSAQIHLLQEKEVKETYKFICDQTELLFRAEDGQVFNESVCDVLISWNDLNYYSCDTTYILNIEFFKPEVTINRSCPTCNDSVIIVANVNYQTYCLIGQTNYTGIWTNEFSDTIGIGDTLIIEDKGDFYYNLFVQHTNFITGKSQFCTVSDTSWHIRIIRDSLSISGDSLICQIDTNTFSLPDAYNGNGCRIKWSIEGLDGQIITDTSKITSKIEVYWPDDNTSDGKICAEIVDTCSAFKKTCKILKGCFITQVNSPTSPYWTVYPNPAREILYIQGAEANKILIKIHDIQGTEISAQPKRAIGGAISIDVHNFAPGIYFIQLSNDEDSQVTRVLIL